VVGPDTHRQQRNGGWRHPQHEHHLVPHIRSHLLLRSSATTERACAHPMGRSPPRAQTISSSALTRAGMYQHWRWIRLCRGLQRNQPRKRGQSGTGLNVTTPGTNGCWATGGIVVDNSSTSAGASQIYFVGLGVNAAGAAGGASGGATGGTVCSGTTPSTTILATQASQSNP